MQAEEFALPAAGETVGRFLPGPAGRLEALIAMPSGSLRGGCVACHPHPLFGGNMTNKVTYTLASAALEAGLAVIRFNFRGVGNSAGLYDESRGETADLLAIAKQLRSGLPAGAPLVLAGFSFGAYVALKAAASLRPALQISVGIPFNKYVDATGPLPQHPGCPWLTVHGTADEVVDYNDTRAILDGYDPPPLQIAIDGGGHFFHGRLVELKRILLPFLNDNLAATARAVEAN